VALRQTGAEQQGSNTNILIEEVRGTDKVEKLEKLFSTQRCIVIDYLFTIGNISLHIGQ
jgi:hypothetical protein